MMLKKGLPIPVTLSLVILVSLFSIVMVFSLILERSIEDLVSASEAETNRLAFNIIHWAIEDDLDSAELFARTIASDRQVVDYFSHRDRGGLLAYVRKRYPDFCERDARFHFHLPTGESFLRVHDPDRYGDDLSALRPMVREELSERTVIRGIEKGMGGYSLRVISPVFDGESFAGSVEYGIDFREGFLFRMKERYDGEYFLYEFTEEDAYRILASTSESVKCNVESEDISKIRSGENVWSTACTAVLGVGFFPFQDFSGNVAGFIKIEMTRQPVLEQIRSMERRLSFVGILLVVGITAISAMTLVYLMRPLKGIVRQAHHISAEISSGNISYRGNVEDTTVDFREVIDAINSIIAALREREILLQAIIEGIPGIVYYLDVNNVVLWANGNALEHNPHIVGMRMTPDMPLQGFFENECTLIEKTIRDRAINSISACYLTYDEAGNRGEECWEHVAVPISDDSGNVKNIIRISQDITDKENAEAKLKKLNETLERRVEEEVERRKSQEEQAFQQSRLASLGELAAGIAHEINQPLNSISFAVENVLSRFERGELREDYLRGKAGAISGDIERAKRIIEHVRTFARSWPVEYRIAFSVQASVENALAMVKVQYATHGIEMRLDIASGLPFVSGNPYQYEQVVLNLLSNAKDAIEERVRRDAESDLSDSLPGEIGIRAYLAGTEVILEVEDNGTGIDETVKDRVFDPFFTTKRPGHGTGLGLSVSYGIIRNMGGTISFFRRSPGTLARVCVPHEGVAGCGA
jgi:signal transduction histidine kinase